jgi:hypothetical protein
MTISRNVSSCAVIAGLLLISKYSEADSIRCGTRLIQEGARVVDIRELCGEPQTVETTTEPIYERRLDGTLYQVGVEVIDYWYYDFGSRRFPVRMTVKGGIAEKIERLSRNR